MGEIVLVLYILQINSKGFGKEEEIMVRVTVVVKRRDKYNRLEFSLVCKFFVVSLLKKMLL